jgi:PAS domain S-box-containing protein
MPRTPSLSTQVSQNILIVEDEPALSSLYENVLSRQGMVRCCGNLESALEALREHAYEVVLLDLGLPDSQGLESLARIRRHAPEAAVVITTGAGDENLALEALRNGAQDYLLKDRLDSSTLVRAIRYALERKQTENKLYQSEELFLAIADNMVDLLSIIQTDGTRVYTGPSYCRLLGYSKEELAGLSRKDLVHPDDLPEMLEALEGLFQDGISRRFEYRIRRRDGDYIPLEANAVLILDAHAPNPKAVLIARDISARKAAEAERERMEVELRQAQKLESIGQLAAGIAHEINTPIQYIGDNTNFLHEAFEALGRVVRSHQALLDQCQGGRCPPEEVSTAHRMLEEADLDYFLAEVPKALAQTLEGVNRVTRIVGAMKDFSHPAGDAKCWTDINQSIESTVTVCRNEWKYVAEMEMDLSLNLPLVPCYPGEFNQAILNLVINAVHAIEANQDSNKGIIHIRTRQVGEAVEILVQDSGCGIPDIIRDRVFDPFFTTKPVGKGSGQGLSIVHAVIVDKHKGSIRLESEVGKGTSFWLCLPLKED